MRKEPIEFVVEGLKLRGNLYSPKQPKNSAVLFLHGWTGMPNENAAEVLAKNGFMAMTFSLSGHNDSDGNIESQTRQKSFKEVLAAYDFLKSKLPEGIRIVVAGNSYGGYLGALLSIERSVLGLHLRVPSLYPDEHWGEPQVKFSGENPDVREWREQPRKFSESRALSAVHNFTGPIQIIEAGEDERLSHQVTQNYLDAITNKNRLDYHYMKGWPHSLGDGKERNQQFQQILLNWLAQQV
jgi:esterase/lipase